METTERGTCRKFRFTDRAVEALPAHSADSKSTDQEYSDDIIPGMKVFVGISGKKTFHLRYRILGRKRCIRIGPFPSLSVKDARLRAHEFKAMIAKDIDPLTERETKAAVPTFEEFALNQYLPFAKTRKRSWAEDEQKIRKVFMPEFGSRRLSDITTRDIVAVHTKVRRDKAPATANRHLTLLARMMALAVQWGVLDKNPALGVKKFPENNARERYLKADEIARMLEALATWPNRSFAGLVKFLLVTGVRRGEAMSLTFDRVDLENGTIFLDKTKSGKTRTVLLNSLAIEVLREMETLRKGTHRYVFPGHCKDAPFVNPRRAFNLLCKKLKITDFHFHDLRHSFASLAVNAGASLYDVQKMLGHSSSQMTQRYSHLSDDSLRAAAETVATSITTGTH
jgi:integrase